ncbi:MULTISPECIES: hypothetical protein [Microbacterium]|jgi:hypothetical protein|uniref:hypothetical protein n=1 Tax=Microbacterium TaxID=33882 RepID=UPI001DD530BA|nr:MULTISPECIES: hypothetical protein [Microbacterium]CAH0177563.1 hypothetical protein SRABI128_01189 [Microbacterium sp. Bi128]
MADESDGISEAFEGQLRVAATAAGRVGEIIARQREEAARRAQVVRQQEARELTSRMNAERQSARAEYGSVHRNDWWERATPEQIGTTLATARAWANEDPEAVRAEAHMRDELRTRYGVDTAQAGGDPQAVRAAVDAELLRRQSETERQRGTGEEAEAALLMRKTDRADRQAKAADQRAENASESSEEAQSLERAAESAHAEAGPKYDSAERRENDANQLEAKGIDREAVAAKMHADVGNAKPATEALKGAPANAVRVRSARSAAARVQRSELSR